MKKVLILCLIFILAACQNKKAPIQVEETTALLFLGPECPLCQDYSIVIEKLYETYHNEINFLAVFSGKHYSDEKIQHYIDEYIPNIKWTKDPEFIISSFYDATITPEAVLVNKQGEIVYQGKLDNWLGELGRRRNHVNEFYLKDAIEATINNQKVLVKRTKPVGCFIE